MAKKTTKKKKKTTKKPTTSKKSSKKKTRKAKTTKLKQTSLTGKIEKPKSDQKKESPKVDKKKSKKKVKKEEVEPVIKEVITVGAEIEDNSEINENEVLEKSGKWWIEEPWRSLLDPDLASNVDLAKFDISKLIEEFIDKMLTEELIDFRISGLAIYSSAKFYHKKITSVIAEEEHIQREEARARLRREIPRAIAQPLRESRKIATSSELFGAMRRAIIETMQKREKLRIRRERSLAKREKQIKIRGKGKLPAEILKHITGSELTIEERLQKTHQKIKEIIRMNKDGQTFSVALLKKMIYQEDQAILKKKVNYIQLFEELLFLASLNKVTMAQRTMRSPIEVTLVDKTSINLS
ncbi:hypothetical protein DSAG12_00819 [Promethearchaeum syntrophicum]|uniref:Segregation and condensation protein A n=1 Tax=Promethearchaeum syntrophicum TaxID=2594042 RepID=A0A5B9D8P5_9ARCH|nr:hypothetical protein [Candidatus Prometheoarchaeum syntrophicum]QEE14996.1 hypothetical protein DSAG12_00819 [Candidatus Prometheoarchaeum syntrophicum]